MNLLAQILNKSKVISLRGFRKYASKSGPKTRAERKEHYGDLFPDKLLTKKHKTPDHMYIADEKMARKVNKHLLPFFKQSNCDTILEINPGIGMFTRQLLDNEEQFKQILLMEPMEYFMQNLQEMHTLYPERVKVKHGDFVNSWKLVYQDKLDNGARMQELLSDVPHRNWDDDPNMLLFGAVGSYNFFKHLINAVIFRNSFLNLGRTEMYLLLPPPTYLHLTCSNKIGYLIYRASSILFQILFEYRFITRLPRDEFLPTQTAYNFTKGSKLSRIRSINPEFLYLVKVVPRRDIHKYVHVEDLPALWYFIKQNCISRSNCVIPNLEKWVPRCGARLIMNAEQPEPSVPLYDDENEKDLPPYSVRCCSINNRDFYPDLNIYTEFGDLTPSQMLTLFTTFRAWPEYKESSFLASFENSMLKIAASAEDSLEGLGEEDDDCPSGDSTKERETNKSVKQSTPTPSSKQKS